MASSFMVVIGERSALAWVLRAERMAFPAYRAGEVAALEIGDELFIYTTRGCFHSPGRDRGRIIGVAEATSDVEKLDPPVEVAGRSFAFGCGLALSALAPYGHGVQLAPLVSKLEVFPNKTGWASKIRRPLVTLPKRDATRLRRRVLAVSGPVELAVDEYLEKSIPRGPSVALPRMSSSTRKKLG